MNRSGSARRLGAVARAPAVPSCITVKDVVGLASIFDSSLNVCVWEREVEAGLEEWLREVSVGEELLVAREVVAGDGALNGLLEVLQPSAGRERFREEINGLVELYADLFGAERVGLRLGTLVAPMCPRFHVDKVGVRMVCTYVGTGTEYLEEADIRRARLGRPLHTPEEQDEVARPGAVIHRMASLAVGLLKGEAWPGNEGRGAVHRSPPGNERRLFLSVDWLG